MLNKYTRFLRKCSELILYILFGALTTALNVIVYAGCYDVLHLSNVISTIIAWILSVLFAFLTNKRFVFRSKNWSIRLILREGGQFFTFRGLTGLLDIGIMYLGVDVWAWNHLVMKMASNVIVIILNYVFSKIIVFRKQDP